MITSIGRTVRWARKRAGMTQQDLARAVRMPQPSIARIERGAVVPRTTTLMAILEATAHELAVDPSGPPVNREAIRRHLVLDVPKRTRQALGRAAKNPRTSPTRILRRLRVAGVPFVLVGDLAEVAHGSPTKVGRVVEVCHAQTEIASDRLAAALEDLEATGSDGPQVRTGAGRLRLLTETMAGDDYELLRRNAVGLHVDSGILVHVAAIEDLIRIRQARGSPEDRAAMAVLRAIGEESSRP
jgi:transcriptional regulator with XRE-family HTH domain